MLSAGRPLLRWWRFLLGGTVVIAVAAGLRDRLPDVCALLAVGRTIDWRWAAVALLSGMLSPAAVGEQDRLLLAGLGVRLPRRRAVTLAVTGAAISLAVPAGSAVAAAFTFRTFRRYGATPAVAATVTVLSGLVSALGLTMLTATGWFLAADDHAAAGWLPVVAVVVLVVLGAGAVWWFRGRLSRPSATAARDPAVRPAAGTRWNRFQTDLTAIARSVRAVPLRRWTAILSAGIVKWALDLTCLAAAAAACHSEAGWGSIAIIYVGVQLVRLIPLTPGGVGLIEVSMAAALVAAGAPDVVAGAVVVLYRLITFWLTLLLGAAGWLHLRRDHPTPPARRAAWPSVRLTS
ncbi:lysylphosphatidylglycerol synthase transmembrane domain-containing protein [Symbioplanes lichenis]|uniref:lysylphosphatidylglycerol synthase transmembrane domain-containing protein n=1 Tax=Symbioplanes lichenis TaxID=1629072 RepID=UPI0027384250|nr:YbhN family protein [Actinoplanes lichenis]